MIKGFVIPAMINCELETSGTKDSIFEDLADFSPNKEQMIGPKTKLHFKADAEITIDFETDTVRYVFNKVENL